MQGPDNVIPKSLFLPSPLVNATSRNHAYKSCLLAFPPGERKRQNNPFQIGTFYFRFLPPCPAISAKAT